MKEFHQGIPISSLPQTFMDAVELTNSLSLCYLWIDSLCIMQDLSDKSEWERECAKMCEIYSGAYISIAASAAIDSCGGLFAPRDLLEITPCIVHVYIEGQGRKYEPFALWPSESDRMSLLANTPLNQRAWVLQERLLAPRTVHFTRRKIFWECPEHIASDTDPCDNVELHSQSYHMRGWIEFDQISLNEVSQTWRGTVRVYSLCNLTYESDKLVAIAGLAKYISSKACADSPLEYLAGLWSHDLALNLLWLTDEPRNLCSRPEQYRAPSWSWAAINGPIYFHYVDDEPHHRLAFIERVETYPISDPFGAVKDGYIRIKGPLCAAVLKGPRIAAYETCITLEGTGKDIMPSELSFDHGVPGVSVSNGRDAIYLLAILLKTFGGSTSTCGLILSPVGDQRGQYIRIGFFEIGEDEGPHRTSTFAFPNGSKLRDAYQKSRLAESLYLESHDDHTFTIKII
jgi:Heterokaryon incompatibility protein (HET)